MFICKSMVLLRKLKMAPKSLPLIVSHTSTAFSENRRRRSARLFSQFVKVPSSFGGRNPVAVRASSKTPVTTSTIIDIMRGSKYWYFCNTLISISSIACRSVFNSSSLSLYNFLFSSELVASSTTFLTFYYHYFFIYLGFLSRKFIIHKTAGEERGYFFNSFVPNLPASQTLRY